MKVVWLSILSLAFCLAFAQMPEQIAQIPLPSDPDVLTGTLDNGIRYYIIQNAKPANRAELRLFVDAGSVLEDDDQKGLAHFTEHMAFNGSTNFGRSEIVEYLASIGMGFANGLNAMTSFDFTMYQLKIPTDNREQLEQGFLILSDMAHQVSFTPEELEKERGIIIEEWRMGQGAQERISNAVSQVMFAGSRYAERTPIGTYDVLTTFGRDEIVRFYEDWYRPDLQSVLVIGDLPKEDALALVEQYFADIPVKENPRPRETFMVPDHPEPRAVVAIDPEFPYSSVTASWTRDLQTFSTLGDYYRMLHERLFFDILNARLEELTQQEDPPFSYASASSGTMLKGLSSTSLMAYTGEGKNREGLRVLLTEAERVRRHGFQESELGRAKARLLRRLESRVEQSSTRESGAIVWSLFGTLMHGNTYMSAQQELDMATQLLPMIDVGAVNRVIDGLITEDNLTVSYTGTQKPGLAHPTEEQLLAVYREVMDSDIEAYEDNEITEPLMAEIPKPGKITKRKKMSQSGIEEWTLSNGVKVYSKKTEFKADEILISAKSIGGFSRYDVPVARNGNWFGDYLGSSGIGEFDNNDLSRLLTGKIASAELSVSPYHEGISGNASPRDMEVLFQLIHQRSVNPRLDSKSLNSFIARMRPFLENMASNPERVFFDSLSSNISGHHPMASPPNVQDLDLLTLESMEMIHRDRFADFSDFSFFVVGNFDKAALEEYVCTYLATLPVARRKDKIVDMDIPLLKGLKEVRFRMGSSESAHAAHVTNGSIKLNESTSAAISALNLVLNEKLRENIREEMSGVYVVQAWQDYNEHPSKQTYSIAIYLACDPGRVDELNKAVLATVDSLRNGLYDDKYVSSAKAVLQKRFEDNVARNSFWLNNMQSNHNRGLKLDSFLTYPALYEKIDKQLITQTARKYLTFDTNRLTVIMTPDTPLLKEDSMQLKKAVNE
jgi:zinc protease